MDVRLPRRARGKGPSSASDLHEHPKSLVTIACVIVALLFFLHIGFVISLVVLFVSLVLFVL